MDFIMIYQKKPLIYLLENIPTNSMCFSYEMPPYLRKFEVDPKIWTRYKTYITSLKEGSNGKKEAFTKV